MAVDPEAFARRPGLRGWLGAGAVAILVAAGAAGTLASLHARAADARPDAAPPPMPVRVLRLERADGYEIEERFAGRIEPARETALAFERAGRVEAVLAEEGASVEAGQILARLDAAPLLIERDRLAAARAALEADLALAEATLARRRALTTRGHDSGQSLDEAQAARDALTARLRQNDAEAAAVALDIAKSELRAPFAGVLAERMIDEGAVVQPGAALARLQETGRPQARVGVPPDRARALAPGAEVAVETPAGTASARLVAVTPDLDPATRTVGLLLDVDPAAPVAMGDLVRLVLPRRVAEPGARAPLSALQEGERGLWTVYVVADGPEGPVARRESVEVVHVSAAGAFVRGAFADGALVVAEGVNRVTQGRRVAPIGE
jgi:RND family efflux transporter MFP subunit